MKLEFGYDEARALVLNAPDRETAFDDYAALIATYRANGWETITGQRRSQTDFRRNWGVSEKSHGGEHLAAVMLMAEDYGITLAQLSTLFLDVKVDSTYQALCVVEDAIALIEHIPLGEDQVDF